MAQKERMYFKQLKTVAQPEIFFFGGGLQVCKGGIICNRYCAITENYVNSPHILGGYTPSLVAPLPVTYCWKKKLHKYYL